MNAKKWNTVKSKEDHSKQKCIKTTENILTHILFPFLSLSTPESRWSPNFLFVLQSLENFILDVFLIFLLKLKLCLSYGVAMVALFLSTSFIKSDTEVLALCTEGTR